MNSDLDLQIQLRSLREKPVFPSCLTLVKNLATRFESVQILPRAVHRIILFLCPPQWDGLATTVETCLKCLFDLVLKGDIYSPQRGWKEQDDMLQHMLPQFIRQKTADGPAQARIQFKLLMQWM